MELTNREKQMYQVMKAIYDSGIPVSFKGSMVLKACLFEFGYTDEVRHTVDIDANWNSKQEPYLEQIAESLQKAVDNCNLNLRVESYRPYGQGKSAGFEFIDISLDAVNFTMDIDVNRPTPDTKIYEIDGFSFSGYTVNQIIADKVSSVSSNKVFRRIKDVIDLYYISMVFKYDKTEILKVLNNSNKTPDNFDGFLNRKEELEHAYEKFHLDEISTKVDFNIIYNQVKLYLKEFY